MNSRADWQQELALAFRSTQTLSDFLGWSLPHLENYPLFVTKKLAEMIKAQGPQGILAKQFLPSTDELSTQGLLDPIGDQAFAQTKQLIHRYGNRVLIIPTTTCPVNCRYCFRKNELADSQVFAQDKADSLNYIQSHPEINEVIFTGGDPLILADEKIEAWLSSLATIGHIKYIRFHSRVPVIIPSRLTNELKQLLIKWSERFKIHLVVHTNHTDEWSAEAKKTVASFQDTRLTWLSQTVLLKGINDHQQTLIELFQLMAHLNIRPYYLHHPDEVRGGMHFWMELTQGRKIWAGLRDKVPGWMLPEYVIDIPTGHGKTQAFNPENLEFSGTLLNRHGQKINLSDESNRA